MPDFLTDLNADGRLTFYVEFLGREDLRRRCFDPIFAMDLPSLLKNDHNVTNGYSEEKFRP